MAKQTINIGTLANDGTGSSPRAAGDIINDNFTEVYDAVLTAGSGNKVYATPANGSSAIPSLRALVAADIPSISYTKINDLTTLLGIIYPVGSIYINVLSTNPATLLGFGTWVAYGAGKTMFGFDGGDADFNSNEYVGGSKTMAHTHTYSSTTGGASQFYLTDTGGGGVAQNLTPEHTHSVSGTTSGASNANILPPYIVTYFWKRTA